MVPPTELHLPADIDLYWSEEQIILSLSEFTPKSPLPSNVLSGLSPYQYPPSNLPEGVWYLVPLDEKKESFHGFWKAKAGEACKVYSNSTIIGWRATLQYFKGQAPDGQITNWVMQEYWITKKELCDSDKPKEPRLLCRVFLCSDTCSKAEKDPKEITITPVATVGHITDTNSCQQSGNDSKAKKVVSEVVEPPPVADNKTSCPPPQGLSDDCFLIGDYLELNDLDIPESHSSSSRNSSCLSILSDDTFGESAFLRDIEEEERRLQSNQSGSRYEFRPVGPDDIVLEPAPTSEIMTAGSESSIEGTSNAAGVNGKKKGGGMKKLRTYLCFKK